MADARIMIGDSVKRTDEDWGVGEVIGALVHTDLSIEYRVDWGDVVAWLPDEKLSPVLPDSGASS